MLDVVAASSEIDGKRETFFKLLFGSASGLLCIAFIEPGNKANYRETFYKYPEQLALVLDDINANLNLNAYFCPQLFRERKRRKEDVELTPNVWADLDDCPYDDMLVEPSLVLESSPGRYQAFWVLKGQSDPDDVENIARRIAYKHAEQGADRSGWDLTQLLRIPHTYNFKYHDTPIVKPVVANRNTYEITDFDDHYPAVDNYIRVNEPKPEINSDLVAEDLLQSKRMTLNPLIWGIYAEIPQEGTWSQVLWKLLLLLFESGFTREEVYVIAQSAACNKYARDGRPAAQLWKDVVRAEVKIQLQDKLAYVDNQETGPIDLMTEEERKQVEAAPDTFVERYIKWATTLGDAATQYHQAGALVALSAILCGSVRLPTSFGTVVPNLWFMILADTTLTRKTTAMDIAMDLIENIDDDTILATDGSIEGLLTALQLRANKPSIFLRDEFAGLLEQMIKKDYMSGMPELLTKLYDGKMQKRVLRKEIIEVKSPRLIIFAGGIKDAVTNTLSTEHIASGFIPRFIFITAESDITRIKPVGPPTAANLEEKEKMLTELMKLHEWYNRVEEVYLPKAETTLSQKKFFDVTMTDEAWLRYNQLETRLVEFGVEAERKDIMTPVGDRLAKSMLKAAILIAASRNCVDEVVVEEIDILRAIKYGEGWFTHTRAIVNRIGLGASERQLEFILNSIKNARSGMPRSNLMQRFKLHAKEYAMISQTLEQRGLITRSKGNRGETLRATVMAD